MLVCGHSAGGHLTAAMVATDWQKLWPKVPSDLVPVGYAISGVFDLTPLTKTSMNQDFRLDDTEARRISPIFWTVPAGRTLDAAVGDLESSEFKRQSRSMADAWRQAKAETRYAELPGNHFTVIDALADPKNAMVARIAELARRISV
jgi:arylformamidase